MNHAVDALFQFDERSVSGEVAHLAAHVRADRVVVNGHFPRILFKLAKPEGDLLLLLGDVENDRLDFVSDLQNLRRLRNALGPGELGNVDKAFNALFKLYKRAVIDEVHNPALDARPDRILALDVLPRIGYGLLQSKRDALALGVHLYDHDGDLLADLHHFGGVGNPAPAHVGDMEKPVETVEVDERAVIGDIFDNALANVAGLDLREELAALFHALFLYEFAARNHYVFALRIDFYNLKVIGLPDVLVEVLRGLDVDLRGREERIHADAHDEAALHFGLHAPGKDCPLLAVGQYLLPILLLLGLVVRDYGIALAVFELLQQDFYLLAYLDVVDIGKFADRHNALALSAYVNYDFVLADFNYFALYY